jgi:hypothetical protein
MTINLSLNDRGKPRCAWALRVLKVLKGLKRKREHPVDNIWPTNNLKRKKLGVFASLSLAQTIATPFGLALLA